MEKLAVQNSDDPAVSLSKGLYTFSVEDHKYQDLLNSWTKDPVNNVVIQDQKVFDSISINSVS